MKKTHTSILFFILALIFLQAHYLFADKINPDTEKSSPQHTLKQEKDNVNAANNNEDYYSEIGFNLIENESLGFLKHGVADIKVFEMLGEPEKKSKLQVMGYDGEKHQNWYYKTKGIQLDMIGAKNKQKIDMIRIKSPCAFRTKRNIGVDSTKEEVLRVYKKEINFSETNSGINPDGDIIIAGTIYGGVFFYIKNDYVSSIFIGSGAE
jgi:hypothetical protein